MPNIEDHIRKAFEEGKFNDLPGKGKPLKLDENPLVDPEWQMAYHVLQSSGYSLPWIETRREILEDLEKARAGLLRTFHWRQAELAGKTPSPLIEEEWTRAQESFRSQAEDLNKRIFNYNLEIPSSQFALAPIDVEKTLDSVSKLKYLTIKSTSDTL